MLSIIYMLAAKNQCGGNLCLSSVLQCLYSTRERHIFWYCQMPKESKTELSF